MDGLVQDLNSALEESTAADSRPAVIDDNPQGGGETSDTPMTSQPRSSTSGAATPSRRRAWRRRCKSTSNLSNLAAAASKNPANAEHSDESSSSGCDGEALPTVPLGVVASAGRRQENHSDTDDDVHLNAKGVRNKNVAGAKASHVRKKRNSGVGAVKPSGGAPAGAAASSASIPSSAIRVHHLLPVLESDSVTEGISGLMRPSTKRKRKFKRMALDPCPSDIPPVSAKDTDTIKRVKVRNPSKSQYQGQGHYHSHQRSALINGGPSVPFTAGKRKRGNREKSIEPEHFLHKPLATSSLGMSDARMDCDEDGEDEEETVEEEVADDEIIDADGASSSSLSSSEWEDDDLSQGRNADPGREADDEQSDWPGPENSFYRRGASSTATGVNFASFSDDDEDSAVLDSTLDAFFSKNYLRPGSAGGESGSGQVDVPLTDTARQAYLARMKRLAECVPGREIRAGARKVRNRQAGFTIKSSSSEQLSRFLQDSTRLELKLSVSREVDRNKVLQMATLYSLSWRCGEKNPNLLILSKTPRTVKVMEFPTPVTPAKASVDYKRRRRTPPNSPLMDGGASAPSGPAVSPPELQLQLQIQQQQQQLEEQRERECKQREQQNAVEEVEMDAAMANQEDVAMAAATTSSSIPSRSNLALASLRSESPVLGASSAEVSPSKTKVGNYGGSQSS